MPISSYLTLIAFWWRTAFAWTLLRLGPWPSKDPISNPLYLILLSMTDFIIYLFKYFFSLSIWLHWVFVTACRVSRCGVWDLFRCSKWNLVPWPEMELGPLHRECGVSATRPPGKSPCHFLADSPHPFKSVPLSFWCLLLSLDTTTVLPTSFWKEIVILGPNCFVFFPQCQVKPWAAIHWECRAWGQNREDQGWGSE